MKSEWRVTRNPMLAENGQYQVYRLLDVYETDHSGNREYIKSRYANEEEAQAIADMYNKKESFVIELGDFYNDYEIDGVKKMRYSYDVNTNEEYVYIIFESGYNKAVLVTCESILSIAKNVSQALLY